MHTLMKFFWGILPLLLSVLFIWLTMEGHLNFGGGEKDIFLAVPLLLWSLVYFCSYLALWWRRSPLGRSVAISAGVATAIVVIASVILFLVSWLKFR